MFLLVAACVLLDFYLPQRLAIVLPILSIAAVVTYLFARSLARRTAQLTEDVDKLLEPHAARRGTGEDELIALEKSLRRTAPRIHDLVENLKLESARREAILESMVEGVLAADQNLRVTFCNRAFARTVGAVFPVNPGTPLAELARHPELREILVFVFETGQQAKRRLLLPGEAKRSVDVLATPLKSVTARGALVILHDVTELERLERVRQDFVANVSHEMRTPLTTIRGYAETLLDGALEDRENNRRFLETIVAQATRLTNIASDLLTLSELESGTSPGKSQTVPLGAVLESALETVESAARVRGVRLVRGQMDDAAVAGGELRLEQVFVNLLDNAVKFNRPGGEVRIQLERSDGKARVTITDTGVGIPSQDLPRIFERFYRVDKARSREMGGTGLGLAIVKHVVDQMGGTVAVESRLGEGSKFTLLLPAL